MENRDVIGGMDTVTNKTKNKKTVQNTKGVEEVVTSSRRSHQDTTSTLGRGENKYSRNVLCCSSLERWKVASNALWAGEPQLSCNGHIRKGFLLRKACLRRPTQASVGLVRDL